MSVRTLLDDLMVHVDAQSNGQLVCTCPWCEKARHLYVNAETGDFDCKRCQEKGGTFLLVHKLTNSGDAEVFNRLREHDLADDAPEQPQQPKCSPPTIGKPITGAKPKPGRQLAEEWGVSESTLKALGLRWITPGNDYGESFRLDMVDAQGDVRGYQHWKPGQKRYTATGTKMGLYVPSTFDRKAETVYVSEGPSDLAVAVDMDLNAVGTPGTGQASDALAGHVEGKHVVLLADHDPVDEKTGKRPGKEGAERLKAKLQGVAASVRIWYPPAEGQDFREWRDAEGTKDRLLREVERLGKKSVILSPLISSAEFAEADYSLEWIVKGILVKDQPAIIGGALKTLKTSVATDLAISVGSCTRFLNEFWINSARVGFISGESGPGVIQETARRQCRARGLTLSQCDVYWGFDIPQLSNAQHLKALEQQILDNALGLVIVDPLYLALLSGGVDIQASNLFQMGPLFLAVADCCLNAGATPILVHHTRMRPATEKHQPPQLEDLAFSGAREFARQWIMLGRREAYEEGTGQHALWLSVGGSAGHSGLWAVDIAEGIQGEDFTGRKWDVTISSGKVVKAERVDQREQEKEQAQDAKTQRTRSRRRETVQKVLAAHPQGETLSILRAAAGMRGEAFDPILLELREEGLAEPCGVTKNKQDYDGFKPSVRATQTHSDPLSQTPSDTHTPSTLPFGGGGGV